MHFGVMDDYCCVLDSNVLQSGLENSMALNPGVALSRARESPPSSSRWDAVILAVGIFLLKLIVI